jgi:hypothetical protein
MKDWHDDRTLVGVGGVIQDEMSFYSSTQQYPTPIFPYMPRWLDATGQDQRELDESEQNQAA